MFALSWAQVISYLGAWTLRDTRVSTNWIMSMVFSSACRRVSRRGLRGTDAAPLQYGRSCSGRGKVLQEEAGLGCRVTGNHQQFWRLGFRV